MKIQTEVKHTPTLGSPMGQDQRILLVKALKAFGYTEANIDLIVRAVNSHEVLLKLAKGFVNAIDERLSILDEEMEEGPNDADDTQAQINYWNAYRKEIEKAITAAEGGK